MTIDEMIAVMQHYRDCGEIETTAKGEEKWRLTDKPTWDFAWNEYRIKEKPKTKIIYELMSKSGDCSWVLSDVLYDEEDLKLIKIPHKKTGRQWEVPNEA